MHSFIQPPFLPRVGCQQAGWVEGTQALIEVEQGEGDWVWSRFWGAEPACDAGGFYDFAYCKVCLGCAERGWRFSSGWLGPQRAPQAWSEKLGFF